MVWIKDSPENRSLAAAVERDAKAKAGVNFARRVCWYGGALGLGMIGAGGLLAGAGAGAKWAIEGYANYTGNQIVAQQAAEAAEKTLGAVLAQEHEYLAETTIKTQGTVTGEVSLKDGGMVGLKDGQQVGLKDNAEVALRKGGTVGLSPGQSIGLDASPARGALDPYAARGPMYEPPPVFDPPPQLRAIGTLPPPNWGTARRSAQAEAPPVCAPARRHAPLATFGNY
jgi:hypothetical protein